MLQIRIERQPYKTIVHCTGRIVMDTWTEFSATVRELLSEGKPIRVDLRNVEQVDSIGIGSFVSVWASAKRCSCDLKFIHPNPRVQDVIAITKLHDMFEK